MGEGIWLAIYGEYKEWSTKTRREAGHAMAENYTTTQLAKKCGVSVRKIISYCERGYIGPSIHNANGHGSRRLWSSNDCEAVSLLAYIEPLLRVSVVREAMASPGLVAVKLLNAAILLDIKTDNPATPTHRPATPTHRHANPQEAAR